MKLGKLTTAVLATVLTSSALAVVAVEPAQAATVNEGAVSWGFKQSFRTYVGNQTAALAPIGPAPIDQRVVMTTPATFDPETPAVPTTVAEAQRPYVFPASGGVVDSASSLELRAAGGVTFNFPSHYFEVRIANPTIKVVGNVATIYADTYYDAAANPMGFEEGHFEHTQVALGTSSKVTVHVSGGTASISADEVTLTAAGAAAVPLYAAGDPLDDFSAAMSLAGPAKVASSIGVGGAISKAYGAPGALAFSAPGTGSLTVNGAGVAGALALAGGGASVALPQSLPVGTHWVTVAYSGDASYLPTSRTFAVVVNKAAPSVSTSWSAKPKVRKKAVLVVKVKGPAGATPPSGKVGVTLKKGKKKVTVKAVTLKSGQVKLSVTAKQAKTLTKGSWTMSLTYTGDSRFVRVVKTTKVSVK